MDGHKLMRSKRNKEPTSCEPGSPHRSKNLLVRNRSQALPLLFFYDENLKLRKLPSWFQVSVYRRQKHKKCTLHSDITAFQTSRFSPYIQLFVVTVIFLKPEIIHLKPMNSESVNRYTGSFSMRERWKCAGSGLTNLQQEQYLWMIVKCEPVCSQKWRD